MSEVLRLSRVSDVADFLLLETSQEAAERQAAGWADSGLMVRRVRGRKMSDKHRVFDEVAAALQFPWYFGENWDAFDECLADLSWLPTRQGYVIVVVDADQALVGAPPDQLGLLVRSFVKAWDEWRRPVESGEWWDRRAIPFHVVLHGCDGSAREIVERWGAAGARVARL